MRKKTLDGDALEDDHGTRCSYALPWDGVGDTPFGCMFIEVGPGAETEPDRHDQGELIFVSDGAGTLRADGEETPLSPGEMVHIPNNVTHVLANASARDPLRLLSVFWPRIEPGTAPEADAASGAS